MVEAKATGAAEAGEATMAAEAAMVVEAFTGNMESTLSNANVVVSSATRTQFVTIWSSLARNMAAAQSVNAGGSTNVLLEGEAVSRIVFVELRRMRLSIGVIRRAYLFATESSSESQKCSTRSTTRFHI